MNRYTVDEIASASGIATSTIRLYRQRGLLEPPEREGRKAFYGPAHLEQLEMITRLKGRGYSLASIKEMLDLWREGESLEAILAPAAGESPTIDLAELVSLLFPDGQADPDVLARAAALGLIKVTEEGIELRDSQNLDIGVRLIRLGVPPSEVLDEYEHLQQVTDGIAQRFANLFETHILPDAADPAQQLSELVRLARAAVEMSLMQSIKREGQQRLRSEPTIEEA